MIAQLLASVLMLPDGPLPTDDDNPLSWVWRQARPPLRDGGLGTASAELLRSSAYFGSFSLAVQLILDHFGNAGLPSALTSPSTTVQLSPTTTTEAAEDAVLAHGVDGEQLSERFTTCHGTYRQHFSAIAQLLSNLGDEAQLSQCNRTCILALYCTILMRALA